MSSAKIGGLRVEVSADRSNSAAVEAVATGTSRIKVLASFAESYAGNLERVLVVFCRSGNGNVANGSSNDAFGSGRFIGGAKSVTDRDKPIEERDGGHHKQR